MARQDDPHATVDRQWFIVGRWQEYEGEGRANLLRILAIGAFYAVQLLQHHVLIQPTDADRAFHRVATAMAAAWVGMALAVAVCLRRQFLPAGLKYVTTAGDILFLTCLAALGAGPSSPLILGYYLIIVLAALRFSIGLVRFATLGCLAGYMATVGFKDERWFDEQHVVPVIQQLVTLLSLGLTGITLGQVIRRVRFLADELVARVQAAVRGTP